MKKNEKNCILQFKKRIFFTPDFSWVLWLCISKMICRAEKASYNILNHSKWRRIEKVLPKCFGHRQVIGAESIYPEMLTKT
jgi:hypothetical protein